MTSRTREMARLYEEGYTLEEVGQDFGVSRERVRQLLESKKITRRNRGRTSPRTCLICQKKSDELDARRCCPRCAEAMDLMRDPTVHPADVASKIGKSQQSVHEKRRSLGVTDKRYQRKNAGIPCPAPKEFFDVRVSAKSLSKRYGVKYGTLLSFRKRHGLKKFERKLWTSEEVRRLDLLLGKGKTVAACAKILCRTEGAVYSFLRESKKKKERR